ncbi:glycolate oxidase subunit GlcF [Polycladidibacter stylochi]|uniref:glycolate oxidase subunit GlcF n=1 Tax=Polycladidibacter stylochi TaxID=1807766 RepID=UPI00082F4E7C|nr:glycolate oxidase subunit GlcF [Pseudovibrio stylochi]
MQTNFTQQQLSDNAIAHSEKILRKCVHCGFCTATCPSFAVLGDELDSPRGRIYMIKDHLENNRPVNSKFVKHVDRCLSCLSCMTTCPSGVHYMHLIDHARSIIESEYKRPLSDRLMRALLASILPYPKRFAWALQLGRIARPFTPILRKVGGPFKKMAAMLSLVPKSNIPKSRFRAQQLVSAKDKKQGRVVVLQGCAQPVLNPEINDATISLLTRLGYEVSQPAKEACCGSLLLHMGKQDSALDQARHNIDIWHQEITQNQLQAIIITASGCGTTIKDYAHMLENDENYAEKAGEVAAKAQDITEFLSSIKLPEPTRKVEIPAVYHSACSMQHGQKIDKEPRQLLTAVGLELREIAEGHLCCGSAGAYNILQPDIAEQLKKRKANNINSQTPQVIATGNLGCIAQLKDAVDAPIVHSVELLNWAYGGEKPKSLNDFKESNNIA